MSRTAEAVRGNQIVDRFGFDPGVQQFRHGNLRVGTLDEELTGDVAVVLAAVDHQRFPAVVNGEIRAIAFVADAATDFDRFAVRRADHGEEE